MSSTFWEFFFLTGCGDGRGWLCAASGGQKTPAVGAEKGPGEGASGTSSSPARMLEGATPTRGGGTSPLAGLGQAGGWPLGRVRHVPPAAWRTRLEPQGFSCRSVTSRQGRVRQFRPSQGPHSARVALSPPQPRSLSTPSGANSGAQSAMARWPRAWPYPSARGLRRDRPAGSVLRRPPWEQGRAGQPYARPAVLSPTGTDWHQPFFFLLLRNWERVNPLSSR